MESKVLLMACYQLKKSRTSTYSTYEQNVEAYIEATWCERVCFNYSMFRVLTTSLQKDMDTVQVS